VSFFSFISFYSVQDVKRRGGGKMHRKKGEREGGNVFFFSRAGMRPWKGKEKNVPPSFFSDSIRAREKEGREEKGWKRKT